MCNLLKAYKRRIDDNVKFVQKMHELAMILLQNFRRICKAYTLFMDDSVLTCLRQSTTRPKRSLVLRSRVYGGLMATDDEIIELYIQDNPVLPVAYIYSLLGIGPNKLYKVLRENNIELRRDSGITSRSQSGSVMGRYTDEIKETIRMLHYIQQMNMTEISAKLSLPYDHVRAIVLELKMKDSDAIAGVSHDDVLDAFKDGATMDALRRNFHLTPTQLLIILDGGTIKQALTDWGKAQGIVDQVLERVRAELNLENSQGTLPL